MDAHKGVYHISHQQLVIMVHNTHVFIVTRDEHGLMMQVIPNSIAMDRGQCEDISFIFPLECSHVALCHLCFAKKGVILVNIFF